MPDFFLDAACHIRSKPDLNFHPFPLESPEAEPHELLEIEPLGDLEGFFCLVEHHYPVHGEYPAIRFLKKERGHSFLFALTLSTLPTLPSSFFVFLFKICTIGL